MGSYLKAMVYNQAISIEKLVRNFCSKNRTYLDQTDFQRFFSLIVRLPMNAPSIKEIWDVYSNQSKVGEKEMTAIIGYE